jgi:cholest-4-en-3-one 26-monooxygenase
MTVPHIPQDFDFTDPDLYAQRLPMAEFAELRKTAPVWWNSQRRKLGGFDDEGFWVVSRHADVKEVSRDSEMYSSWENTAVIRFAEDFPRERIELQRFMLLNTDPPHHTQLRAIVSRGFTPRAIGNLRDALAERAGRVVTQALAAGTGDFVTDIASELPLQAIAELLGVPQEDRRRIFDWSNQMLFYDDPEFQTVPEQAALEVLQYFMAMAEERRKNPADDVVTKLVQADENGNLSPDEFGFFVILLMVAGNETTRNAISHGMLAFLDNPDQWELYRAERPATTADEIVRWSTPVVSFQRTAMRDTVLDGQEIKAGDRVGLFYSSANFDSDVFDAPERFDIRRDPNPHLGFGGSGAHFCLGASLARMEINAIFNAIADHIPDTRPLGPVKRVRAGWLNGVKEFPVRYA